METNGNSLQARQAAINGLAVAGFVALVAAGMWLAVYSTRFVPTVVSRIGSAAVYLSSVFTPASTTPALVVVPNQTASSTTTLATASTTATSTPARPIEVITLPSSSGVASSASAPVAGDVTTGSYQIGGTAPTALSHFPDLTVRINAIGYLATSSANSFVANSTVPAGSRPAVNFTIKNIGTNVSGPWNFSASIPTQNSYVFQSNDQQTLSPGDSIDYTLGFDQPTTGTGKTITITANPSHTFTESTFDNNTASTTITVLGN